MGAHPIGAPKNKCESATAYQDDRTWLSEWFQWQGIEWCSSTRISHTSTNRSTFSVKSDMSNKKRRKRNRNFFGVCGGIFPRSLPRLLRFDGFCCFPISPIWPLHFPICSIVKTQHLDYFSLLPPENGEARRKKIYDVCFVVAEYAFTLSAS